MRSLIYRQICSIGLCFLFIEGCSYSKSGEVFVIERTRTFHREQCPPVNMAKTIIMNVAEAKVKQYKPCPNCKPEL